MDDRNSKHHFSCATAFICLLLALAIYMAAYYAMLASGPATFHLCWQRLQKHNHS